MFLYYNVVCNNHSGVEARKVKIFSFSILFLLYVVGVKIRLFNGFN